MTFAIGSFGGGHSKTFVIVAKDTSGGGGHGVGGSGQDGWSGKIRGIPYKLLSSDRQL